MFKKARHVVRKAEKFVTYKWILPALYHWNCRKPIDEKLVIFLDHRRNMPDNFEGIYELCKNHGMKCEFFFKEHYGPGSKGFRKRISKFIFAWRFMCRYARCNVVFLDDWTPLTELVKPREGTQVVQLWHGCGLLKRWGYAVSSKEWARSENDLKLYPAYPYQTLSTVSSNSPIVINGYKEAFRCDEGIIKPLGSPRTDVYFDPIFKKEARQKILEIFPQIGERKIILYAPTFRGKLSRSYIDHTLDLRLLKGPLSEKYAFVTKFHPLLKAKGLTEEQRKDGEGFLFDVTERVSAAEALCAADLLITDYSSILFEYLLLERPMISYLEDLQQYEKDRGLFHPYEMLVPGPYVTTQQELLQMILTVDEWFDIERIKSYKNEFMSACDGHSTERIFNYVFGYGA